METSHQRHVDVLVIGGGLAGLAAAATAARAGARVEVLEARSEPGGRARTADRDGFLVNEGAHALYRGGEGIEVLRDLGVEPDGGVPATRGTSGMLEGTLGVLPAGPGSLARTTLLGAKGKFRVARLLGRLGKVDAAALAGTSTADWVARTAPEPDAGRLLHALVRLTTYADDPEHFGADAAVRQLQRALDGNVLYLHGGWQPLVDGLRGAAEAAGVALRTGAKVERVVPGAGAVDVWSGGEVRAAGAVILAAGGPSGAAAVLDAPVTRAWAAAARPCRAAALDLCMGEPWGGPGFVIGIDRPLYVSDHTRVARVAPPGCSLVSAMKYLRADVPTDPDADRADLEDGLDRVRPGWREAAADVLYRPRLVATTDIPRAEAGGLPGRPGPEVPGAPGVLVAGDWVGPTGILADAALASGAEAGRRAAVRRGVAAAA